MLEFNNCIIGRKRDLYRIPNLTLEASSFVGLVGANGTGKSTLLSALSLGDLKTGHISLNQQDWLRLSSSERAKQVALVDNSFAGLAHLSVQEFLELGRFPHTGSHGRLSMEDKEVVLRYATEMCVEHLLDQPTSTLSDGERQRCSIARALIQETALILLDEPTSFLDYPTKKAVMAQLREIADKNGKLILMASHDLELCARYCTDALVIQPTKEQLVHLKAPFDLNQLLKTAFTNPV